MNIRLPGFTRYIAITEQTRGKLAPHTGKPIDLIYCGVGDAPMSSVDKAEHPTLVCVARFVHYKNHAFLLRSFARVDSAARLVLIGSGPERGAIEALITSLGLTGRVTVLSELPRDELLRQVARGHVFALASLVEGFGIATIEAAQQGLPYVNSDIPTHREVLGSVGGFLVSATDQAAYAEKLSALLFDPALRAVKSAEARELAGRYAWDKIAEQTEQTYLRALGR